MTNKIAVILNFGLLCILSYFLFDKGLPGKQEMVLVLLAFLAPAVSLIALLQKPSTNKEGLFSLFVERKKLEEQQRITQLKSSSKNV